MTAAPGADEAKAAGNKAMAAGDFAVAEQHYSAALAEMQGSDAALQAALLCNRALARQRLNQWQPTVEDTSAALEQLQNLEEGGVQALRVKALYRRALALEELGEASSAFQDLNAALKLAPQNAGIREAAQRLKAFAPKEQGAPRPRPWCAEYPFCTKLVMELADSERWPGRIRGFTPVDSDAVVKFPCGLGVAVRHGDGGLSAIWPLGPPQLLPRVRERLSGKVDKVHGPPELGEDFFAMPNMRPGDGLHFRYGRGGDLRWLFRYHNGALEGLSLRFEPDGSLREEACGLYEKGTLVEKWQACLLPAGYLGHALAQALPVKKALGIGLSPCEERLCYEHCVDVDGLAPAELGAWPAGQEAPEVPVRLSPGCQRPNEWWRAQLEVVDPAAAVQRGKVSGFAPIGPSDRAPEVQPLLLNDAPHPSSIR